MKKWVIKNYKNKKVNWDEVPILAIDEYPWYQKGLKQATNVQIAISKDAIYIHAKAEDRHIRARAKNLMDPVYEDSCFEFFITPWNQRSTSYFNIEINCMGVLYMVYHDGSSGTDVKTPITKKQAKLVTIESSLAHVKDIKAETGWELKIIVPISLLEEMSGREIHKDVWHGNFYRCGGENDDQYAAWNPLECEIPNYHLPMQFGQFIIKA